MSLFAINSLTIQVSKQQKKEKPVSDAKQPKEKAILDLKTILGLSFIFLLFTNVVINAILKIEDSTYTDYL